MPFAHIHSAIAERQQQNLLRQPVVVDAVQDAALQIQGKTYLNFSGNDYLGMSQHPDVLRAFASELPAGSGASPVVTGYSKAHQQLGEYLSELTGQQAVMFFSSGFAANYAVCKTLMCHSEGLILADKLSHASLIDGGLSADAAMKRFRHNDMEHLQSLLATAKNTGSKDILVVSEGVFSMDGDQAPVAKLLEHTRQHNAWLMLDNAHSIGVLGAEQFALEHNGETQKPEIIMATFGKAVGTGGAFVAGSKELITYLQNFARHYVYSTAFSAAHAHATLTSLTTIEKETQRLAQLNSNIAVFREACKQQGIEVAESKTAIQPVIIGSPKATMDISESLRQQGYWVTGIRYPTVPKHTDRLRITLSALHQENHIKPLVACLAEALQKNSGALTC